MLTDSGLLRHAGKEKKTYHPTEMGIKFLNMYNEIDAMIPEANALTTKK
jgi:predicted transcriptional regulator